MACGTSNGCAETPADGAAWIACHDCDLLHRRVEIPRGARAHCRRCGARLYRGRADDALHRAAAFQTAALVALLFANLYPFLSLKIGGRIETVHLIDSAAILIERGMAPLAPLVLLTSAVLPLAIGAGRLYLLLPRLLLGRDAPGARPLFRALQRGAPWSMAAIFMFGTLIAVVKLLDLAEVIPEIGAGAFMVAICLTAAAELEFDARLLWPQTHAPPPGAAGGAREHGLASCHLCGALASLDAGGCPRCGAPVHARKPESEARTWALLASAALLLLPANLYPVMTVQQLGRGEPSTILAGIVHLAEAGMWGLALIIFFASVVVPGLKLAALSWILWTIRRRDGRRAVDRTRLYRLAEAVGAWSMVDVFVVALLAALVQFGFLATIEPGLGALFFAAVVVVTMLAAESFDPRLIWDNLPAHE